VLKFWGCFSSTSRKKDLRPCRRESGTLVGLYIRGTGVSSLKHGLFGIERKPGGDHAVYHSRGKKVMHGGEVAIFRLGQVLKGNKLELALCFGQKTEMMKRVTICRRSTATIGGRTTRELGGELVRNEKETRHLAPTYTHFKL